MTLRTVPQAAADLELAERTVRDQLAAGVLVGAKVGRDWLVDQAEIDRYRRENLGRRGPKPGPDAKPRRRRPAAEPPIE